MYDNIAIPSFSKQCANTLEQFRHGHATNKFKEHNKFYLVENR
jgi:hypothetical protein